jgi:Zn-dependent protease
MNPEQLKLGVLWYLIFLVSLVIHEFAHAITAYKLGDRTAFEEGQVSLNPIPHIRREIFGTVVVPILSFILGGWMFGWASTPYDYKWAEQNMRKSAKMALAGPASNLLLVVLAALLIRIGYAYGVFNAPASINFSAVTESSGGGLYGSLATILSIFFSLNLILMMFNLLPLPNFDGSSILLFFVEGEQAKKVFAFINNRSFFFISIFIAWRVFDYIFSPIHLFAINLLYPGVSYH